jgi:hypothetical protein
MPPSRCLARREHAPSNAAFVGNGNPIALFMLRCTYFRLRATAAPYG